MTTQREAESWISQNFTEATSWLSLGFLLTWHEVYLHGNREPHFIDEFGKNRYDRLKQKHRKLPEHDF